MEKVRFFIGSGQPMKFAKPLIDLPPATHRFRIGKYRVCFFLQGDTVVINAVDLRGDVYRRQ